MLLRISFIVVHFSRKWVDEFPVSPLWIIEPPSSNARGLCWQLLPWLLSKHLSLLPLSPLSLFSITFRGFTEVMTFLLALVRRMMAHYLKTSNPPTLDCAVHTQCLSRLCSTHTVPLYTVQYTHSASLHCAVHTQCLSTLCNTHTVPLCTVQYTHSASLDCAVHTQCLSRLAVHTQCLSILCSTHTVPL